MKPVVIGAVVAILVIGAFLLGSGALDVDQDGPAEKLGEALDKAAEDVKEGVESTGN